MRIKDWNKFQHFKDRRPPWIKLYREILDDPEWHELDPASAKVLVMIWLIASEEMGELPTIKKLAFRLRLTEKQVEIHCSKLSHWLIQDDINVISDQYQLDAPETEEETETKKERETKKEARTLAPPEGVSHSTWQDFLKLRKAKKAPMTDAALQGIKREARKAGWSLEDALAECCLRGWQAFKADWVAEKVPIQAVTTPAKQGPDPALARIIADGLKAVKPPEDVREKMRQLTGK
jgi:hypothetical protein